MDCYSVLELIEKKCNDYEIETDRCVEIRKSMNEFEVCVVVVGAFSAGKTAMINSFLKKDLLKENQLPETSIASELVYDTREFVEAFSDTGTVHLTIQQACELNDANQYLYLRWHLNNEALAGIKGYTIVDMPGFNSNIESHNKAILRYIDKATSYLLVIDAEDGGIKQSIEDFLQEIRNYKHSTSIVITKCDLKSFDSISEIRTNVSLSAEAMFGETIPVITMSVFDENCSEKISSLINEIDKDLIFEQRFIPSITLEGESLISSLEFRIKNEKLNLSELQKEIEEREKNKKSLEQSLRLKLSEVREKYGYQTISEIMSDVEVALLNEVSTLSESLKNGEKSFSAKVNSILRPIFVNSLKKFTNKSYNEFSNILEFQGQIDENAGGKNIAAQQQLILYRAVTGIFALTNTIVAPWLEIVMIMAPDIMNFFSSLIGNKNNNSKMEDIVRNKVISQIIAKLHPEMTKSLNNIQEEVTKEIEDNFKSKIENEIQNLNSLKQKIINQTNNHEQSLSKIKDDIQELRSAIDSLQMKQGI